jgi:hypothetical protein
VIAILGIVILHYYNIALDRRLASLPIEPEVRSFIDDQRARLGATELPASVNEQTRLELRAAIDESFVAGFRVVVTTAIVLALASALSAFIMIEGKSAHGAVAVSKRQ